MLIIRPFFLFSPSSSLLSLTFYFNLKPLKLNIERKKPRATKKRTTTNFVCARYCIQGWCCDGKSQLFCSCCFFLFFLYIIQLNNKFHPVDIWHFIYFFLYKRRDIIWHLRWGNFCCMYTISSSYRVNLSHEAIFYVIYLSFNVKVHFFECCDGNVKKKVKSFFKCLFCKSALSGIKNVFRM